MASLLRKVEPGRGPEAMSDAEAADVEENPSETKQFLDQGISDANKEYESALQTSEWRQEVGEDGKLLRLIGRMPFSFGDQYVVADNIETTEDGELIARRIGIPLMEPVAMFQFDLNGEAFLPSCNLVEAEGRFNLSTSSKELASEGPVVWTYFNKGSDRLVRAVESGWHVFVERDGSATLNRLMSDTVTWQLPEPVEFPRDRVEQVPEVVDQHLSMVHEFLSEFKVDPKTASPLQTGTDVDTNFVAMSDPSVVELSDPNQVSPQTLLNFFQMTSERLPNIDDVANGALRRAGEIARVTWENFAEVAQALIGQPTVDSSEEAQQRYAQAQQADNLQQLGFVAVVCLLVVSLALMLGMALLASIKKEVEYQEDDAAKQPRTLVAKKNFKRAVGETTIKRLWNMGATFAGFLALGGGLRDFLSPLHILPLVSAVLSAWYAARNRLPLGEFLDDLRISFGPIQRNVDEVLKFISTRIRQSTSRENVFAIEFQGGGEGENTTEVEANEQNDEEASADGQQGQGEGGSPTGVERNEQNGEEADADGQRGGNQGEATTDAARADEIGREITTNLAQFGNELKKTNPDIAALAKVIDTLKRGGRHETLRGGFKLNTVVYLVQHFAKHKVDLAKVFYRAVRGLSGNDSTDPIGGPTQRSTFQLLLRVIYDIRNTEGHEDEETVQLAMIYAGLVRSRIVDRTSNPEARFREIMGRRLDFPENELQTVGEFLTTLRSNEPENTVKFPFSDLTTQTFFEGLFRSATTAERNAKALYIALQKKRLLGDPDLWFLEDQDARYVSEIARVVREKIDELRHKSGSGNDERSLLPGTELEGTLQFKGTDVMQWKARFGKRGLVAYVYAADVGTSDAATRAQNPDDATASHFGVEKADEKWVAVKQLEKNLPAGENNRTLDTVLLQAAKLQFTDALRRMRQAFRRGDYYFGIDQPELPAPRAPAAAAEARGAVAGTTRQDSPTGQTPPDTAASLDTLLASHAAATDRMRAYLEEL